MEKDVYSVLCQRMNEHPVGAPETEHFIEILRTLYTPEEAEFAALLNFVPEPVADIVDSSGLDEDQLLPMLEEMAAKGLIFSEVKEGKVHFGAFSTCPGLWEISFAKGERNPRTEYLARMWREYYKSGWWKEMHPTQTPLTRIFPVERSITPQQHVLPFEQAAEILKKTEHMCVIHCPCRTAADLAGEGCGKPKEVCLILGYLAEFMIERGYGRKVTAEEGVEILKTTDDAGLVHLTMNTQDLGDDALGICSCCKCCCSQLRAMTEMGKSLAIAKSRFSPVLDAEKCTACGICEERCQTFAITVDGAVNLDLERCIGCGLCVTGCPTGAFSLQEKDGYQQPLADLEELFQTFLEEKAAKA